MKPHPQDAHVAYVERQKSGMESLGFKAISKWVLLSYNSLSEAFTENLEQIQGYIEVCAT